MKRKHKVIKFPRNPRQKLKKSSKKPEDRFELKNPIPKIAEEEESPMKQTRAPLSSEKNRQTMEKRFLLWRQEVLFTHTLSLSLSPVYVNMSKCCC